MEQSETKVLPVALTKEQRVRLGVMAAERCVAMTELVRWWIDEKWGGRDSKLTQVERKEASVRSYEVKKVEVPGGWSGETQVKPTPLKTKFGAPVETEVPMAKCRKCGESFPVADMVTEPKSGKLFCGDCVENMKNGQG